MAAKADSENHVASMNQSFQEMTGKVTALSSSFQDIQINFTTAQRVYLLDPAIPDNVKNHIAQHLNAIASQVSLMASILGLS
jgi:hypothetical protein